MPWQTDQKRIVTPQQALDNGSSVSLVIVAPNTKARGSCSGGWPISWAELSVTALRPRLALAERSKLLCLDQVWLDDGSHWHLPADLDRAWRKTVPPSVCAARDVSRHLFH